MIVYFV